MNYKKKNVLMLGRESSTFHVRTGYQNMIVETRMKAVFPIASPEFLFNALHPSMHACLNKNVYKTKYPPGII